MKTTDLTGKHVMYKDAVGFKHSGNIVGMSDDGKWYLVKADSPNAPKAEWHFKVRASEIESYLKHGRTTN